MGSFRKYKCTLLQRSHLRLPTARHCQCVSYKSTSNFVSVLQVLSIQKAALEIGSDHTFMNHCWNQPMLALVSAVGNQERRACLVLGWSVCPLLGHELCDSVATIGVSYVYRALYLFVTFNTSTCVSRQPPATPP